MKRSIYTILFTLLYINPVVSQVSKSAVEISPLEINYGIVKKKSNGIRHFEVKNKSEMPVLISQCKGSCGCTVPICPKEPIMPGKSAPIEVKYDTYRLGVFQKTITLHTSDPTKPQIVLSIKGEVIE